MFFKIKILFYLILNYFILLYFIKLTRLHTKVYAKVNFNYCNMQKECRIQALSELDNSFGEDITLKKIEDETEIFLKNLKIEKEKTAHQVWFIYYL